MAEIDGFIADSDKLYTEAKFSELREAFRPYENTDNPHLLWRLARALKEFAEMAGTPADVKKQSHLSGFEFAKKGLEKGPDVGACHKYYGILLSRYCDYQGSKKKLEESRNIRQSFEKALELDPNDATSAHLIGRWCFVFAELSWYEKKIASVLFSKPPEVSYDDALVHLLKAEEMNPNFYCVNQFLIADIYQKKGDKVKAKEWFQKILSTTSRTDEALQTISKAQEHLKSL